MVRFRTGTLAVKCIVLLSLCAHVHEAGAEQVADVSALTGVLNTRDQPPPVKKPVFYDFVTRPDIGAPRWNIQVYDKRKLSPGYWFVAPYANLDQGTFPKWNGPHIYDKDGELVWSGAPLFSHWNTFDFRIVEVGGKSMLSLLDPHEEDAEGVILDDNYKVQHTVDLTGELKKSNMHDFTVVDNGVNALTLTNVPGPSTVEQSRVIGFDGECRAKWEGFKELRVEDSEVLFEWSARDWIGLEECMFIPRPVADRCSNGTWDILHLNSIDKFPDGDYLVSSRHMNTLYKVSHTDGHIVWRLGGKKSDFDVKDTAVFSRQHHARVHAQNETHVELSLFDNAVGSGPPEAETATSQFSRGLHFALRTDTKPMTAQLLAHYDHPRGGLTNSRGSMQFLPNGNIFMGWTYSSRQSEHSVDGKVLMEANFREGGAHSYRNYKFPWVGRPTQPPDVYSAAIDVGDGNGTVSTMVYVSWNGATEVNSWRLYKSNVDGTATELVGSTLKQGFETAASYDGYAAFVMVEARDDRGHALEFGRSEIIRTVAPQNRQSEDVAAEMRWLQQHSSTDGDDGGDHSIGFLQNPFVGFVFGVVCSVLLCCAAMYWQKRGRSLYEQVARRQRATDQISERYREDVEEFDLDSDGTDGEDEAKPLAR